MMSGFIFVDDQGIEGMGQVEALELRSMDYSAILRGLRWVPNGSEEGLHLFSYFSALYGTGVFPFLGSNENRGIIILLV